MNRFRTIVFLALIFTCILNPAQASIWKNIPSSIFESEIRMLVNDPHKPKTFWVGTERGLYQSVLKSGREPSIHFVKKFYKPTNDLYIAGENKIFAATDQGVYLTLDDGRHWQRIFTPQKEEGRCLSVVDFEGNLFIGTTHGLYLLDEHERSAHPINTPLNQVHSLHTDGMYIYAAGNAQIVRLNVETLQADSVYRMTEEGEPSGEEARFPLIHDVVIDSDLGVIYVASRKEIVYQELGDSLWQPLPTDGLPLKDVREILVISEFEEPLLFAATRQGTFSFLKDRWSQVYAGMYQQNVMALVKSGGEVFAGTASGLYVLPDLNDAYASFASESDAYFKTYRDVQSYFSVEPSIQDVHAMAIRYADVDNDKIRRWQNAARRRAFMPSLSAGLDRNATELLHWDTGASPDRLVKGREYYDWDLGLSWDLGDLVWNPDQTSIDSRAKLMIELREDILDQVTRLYFERRRLQMELLAHIKLPPADLVDREMRVDELTALLDSYTGGEFSRKIQRNIGFLNENPKKGGSST